MRRTFPAIACAAGLLGLSACGSHPAAAVSSTTSLPPVTTSSSSAVPTTSSSAPPTTSSAPPALTGSPLTFAWTVSVSGKTVTVGGTWSGTDGSLTASQISADPQISSGAQAGSGVLAYSGTVLTSDGQQVPAGTAPAEADFTVGVYSTDGDVPTSCDGPVAAQTRTAKPMTLTFAEPGTYEVQMKTQSCAGSHTDTKVFTVS